MGGISIKLGLADAVEGGPQALPGAVLGPDAEGLLVATGNGILRLRKLQRPGGRMLGAQEFLRGFAVPGGTVLASLPMPPLWSPSPFRR